MEKVIFLDCDGVLNNAQTTELVPSVGFIGADEANIIQLYRIVQKTHAQIVLSSTWQNEPGMFEYLKGKLAQYHMEISDVTGEKDINRGHWIECYIQNHSIDHYVILDDYPFEDFYSLHLDHHLVLTDYEIGLSGENVPQAIHILNDIE